MVLALLGFIYWEKEGRQQHQEQTILVSSHSIYQGQLLKPEDVKAISLNRKLVVDGALTPKQISFILNKKATQFIPGNMVLLEEYFKEKGRSLPPELSVFTLPSHWIYSRSSTLRRGDWVELYDRGGEISYGSYEIVFVKTAEDYEVESTENKDGELPVLERRQSSGIVHHLEILCSIQDYSLLYHHVSQEEGQFVVVQREGE